jgi:hypothetical protein
MAASVIAISLPERERNHTHGQQQKHVKCASNKVGFYTWISLFFHDGVVLSTEFLIDNYVSSGPPF